LRHFHVFFSPVLPPPITAYKSTGVSTDLTIARLKRQPNLLEDGGMFCIEDMTVVTPDTLLVSNRSKKCVQLVDSRQGQVLSEVQLQGAPGRMCLTDRNTAAVVIWGQKKIQMIQMKDNTLTLGKVLTVIEDIQAITSSRNSLVVSYDKLPWLEVISIDEQVLNQFDRTGNPHLLKNPAFMCTSPDESIFISDYGTNKITKVDAQLNILRRFTSPLLQDPRGITARTEDEILVCSRENNSLVLIQPSTNKISTFLEKNDWLDRLYTLTYCPDKKKIYIAPSRVGTIEVYQIT